MLNWLKNLYQDNAVWLRMVIQWFVLAMVLGGLTFFFWPNFINQILNLFQDKFGSSPSLSLNLAREIFVQNGEACLIALAGGILLGIPSFLIVFFNGFIIGFVILSLVAIPGNPLHNILYAILGIVPHGIFELPAFFLASALGTRLGIEWLNKENSGKRLKVLGANLVRALYSIPVLAGLLLFAALVEVFVSGKLVGNF